MKLSALFKGGVKGIGNPASLPKPVVMEKANNENSVPASYKRDALLRQLEPFRLDTVGSYADPIEINRVNNMAWEFMQKDGISFSDAVRLAAEIVVSCDVAICEAAYSDVTALWQRLKAVRSD